MKYCGQDNLYKTEFNLAYGSRELEFINGRDSLAAQAEN